MQTSYSPSSSRSELAVGQAESPVLLVVRRAIGDPVGPVRQRVQVLPQLRELHPAPDRDAVADDVEVRLLEVDHLLPLQFFTQASLMFHSLGTVQSKTLVPLGTSRTSSGMCLRTCARSHGIRPR